MKLLNPQFCWTPPGIKIPEALKKTTHLGIGAHADDLEILAFHGIVSCYKNPKKSFAGLTLTNGSGSPRAGRYAKITDAEMIELRRQEQIEAAKIGEYGLQIVAPFSSQELKNFDDKSITNALQEVFEQTRPEVVYTHNPADRHDSHVAVAQRVILAIRNLPKEQRPKRVLGCEVWRDLDWLPEGRKVYLDVSGHDVLAEKLILSHASQVEGGKRYDLGTLGRRRAHATFASSSEVDQQSSLILAMDLRPLVDSLQETDDFLETLVEEFRHELTSRVRPFLNP